MINKKNYWLFSIVLLAAAESTYDASCGNKDASPRKKGAGCLKKCKECCCGKLCNKDDERKGKKSTNSDNSNNNNSPEIEIPNQNFSKLK